MIKVVAAVITNEEGKVLITKRNIHKSQGGLWEFPGGKIEPNETRDEAIVREIKEELNLEIKVDGYLDERVFEYPDKTINLIALRCSVVAGKMKLNEHEDAKWVSGNEIGEFEFAPADEFVVECLKGISNQIVEKKHIL